LYRRKSELAQFRIADCCKSYHLIIIGRAFVIIKSFCIGLRFKILLAGSEISNFQMEKAFIRAVAFLTVMGTEGVHSPLPVARAGSQTQEVKQVSGTATTTFVRPPPKLLKRGSEEMNQTFQELTTESPVTAPPVTLLKTINHPEHHEAIAELLTEAFDDHPLYTYVFQETQPKKQLYWLNVRRLKLLGERSEFWLDENQKVAGHVTFAPGNNMSPSLFTLISLGFLKFPFLFGFDAFNRFNSCMDAMGALEKKLFGSFGESPGDNYWTLEAFAVRKDLRGKGLGGRVLDFLIQDRLVKKGDGSRVVLLTQEQKTHDLYEKKGFTDINGKKHSLQVEESFRIDNWAMELQVEGSDSNVKTAAGQNLLKRQKSGEGVLNPFHMH